MPRNKRSRSSNGNSNGHFNGNGDTHVNRLEGLFNGKVSKINGVDIAKKIKVVVVADTPNQKYYLKTISENHITVCTGQSGTGKTRLAMGMAAKYLVDGLVERIIITRPTVDCDESLGFVPGDLNAKMSSYTRPAFDELGDFLPDEFIEKCLQGSKPVIEVVPLGQMKGRTFKNAFIILDEAEDATEKQLKNFLTRFGTSSKIVITGDLSQSDMFDYKKQVVPMGAVMEMLEGVEGIAYVKLTKEDNHRHPLVNIIVERFEERERR